MRLIDDLLQMTGARLERLEQAGVDERDRGVVRHGFQHSLLAVQEGTRLLPGDAYHPDGLIAHFDGCDQRRLSETGQLELAEVTFANVQREYERSRSLLEKQLISKQEYESKQAEYDEAELRSKLARE